MKNFFTNFFSIIIKVNYNSLGIRAVIVYFTVCSIKRLKSSNITKILIAIVLF